jgi:hypothetical protein
MEQHMLFMDGGQIHPGQITSFTDEQVTGSNCSAQINGILEVTRE